MEEFQSNEFSFKEPFIIMTRKATILNPENAGRGMYDSLKIESKQVFRSLSAEYATGKHKPEQTGMSTIEEEGQLLRKNSQYPCRK